MSEMANGAGRSVFATDQPQEPITYLGFTFVDRGRWRRVGCPTCPKTTDFVNPTPERMDWIVDTHVCGDAGLPWSTPGRLPAGPAASRALLLRSVAGVVLEWGPDACDEPLLAAAAGGLVEVLQSYLGAAVDDVAEPEPTHSVPQLYARRLAGQLQPGDPTYVSCGELLDHHVLPASPTGDEAVGISWSDLVQCSLHLADDIAAGRLEHVRPATELGLVLYADDGVVVDQHDHHELVPCSGCVAPRRGLRVVPEPLPTPAAGQPAVPFVDEEGRRWVSVAMLVTYGVPDFAAGVEWPEWRQCAAHLAEEVAAGELAHRHDPAEQCRLILRDEAFDPNVDCLPCTKVVPAEVPAE